MVNRLNLVALLYRWSVARAARGVAMRPVEFESIMTKNRRGARRRTFVAEAMAARALEIIGIALALAALGVVLSRTLDDRYPGLAAAFNFLSAAAALFPLSLMLGIVAWALVPQRRDGGWFNHAERLWPPTILTLLITVLLGLAAVNG